MLERGPQTSAATQRQRRYRRRLRDGTMPVTVDIDASVVSMLVETGWLGESDSGERTKIAEALSAMLLDAAAKYQ
jgi:hypothetical protein